MPTTNNTPDRARLLAGFTHIPLYDIDLEHFGDEIELGVRLLRAVHRDHAGHETGREIIHGGANGGFSFTKGGRKALFRSPGRGERLVLTDGPLQAIALAAIEHPDLRRGTTYAAPGGPMTKAATAALSALLQAHQPGELVFGFAPAPDGSSRSLVVCQELLAGLLLPAAPRVRIMSPAGPDGWVGALRATRMTRRAA